MSLNDRDRLAVLSQVRDGRMNLNKAAQRLDQTYRQARRLWKRYR